jgi:hypothetical protein
LLASAAWAADQPPIPADPQAERDQRRAEVERKRAEMQRRRAETGRLPAGTAAKDAAADRRPPKPEPHPAHTYNEKTRLFSTDEGRFTAWMPAAPKGEKLTAAGVPLKAFNVEEKDGAYVVAYADMPVARGVSADQAQTALDFARDGMVRNVNAQLTGESRIWLAGKYPGREVRAELPGKVGIVRARLYLVDRRLYQVMVVGRAPWANSADAGQFLNSFALKP